MRPPGRKTTRRATLRRVEAAAAYLTAARKVLEAEAQAILAAAARLEPALSAAVETILRHPGKIIVTGIGKSGHVGRQVAATLQSTGTPAVFLHPAEAAHGEHEKRSGGQRDANWSDWYAAYMVAEQAGKELPL